METSFLLAGKITELTLIVLMGVALVKAGLLKSENSYTLSVIALYLISPSVMIHAFQMDNTPQIIEGLKLSVMLAVFFHVVLIVLGRLFKHLFKLDALEHAATVYSNSGNLIIPLVMSVFWCGMGDLHQRFYHGADIFVLDTSAPVDLRPRQCGLENHFYQYQHLIHVGRAADVCLSNQAAAHCR